jgi:hypothetical protein
MITVKMTETEYKAYLLYLKSIEIMKNVKISEANEQSLAAYFSDPEIQKEIDSGIKDIDAGRLNYIDPGNIWESIK